MAIPGDLAKRLSDVRRSLDERGQSHALCWWDQLDDAGRELLLRDLESVPWGLLDSVIPTHVLSSPAVTTGNLSPATVLPSTPTPDLVGRYESAVVRGGELLRTGKVAAFTVAGGQGTRLGHDGPKGTLVVTPVGERTLFQLFAEMILAASTRYGCAIPWYIMTSEANHEETERYFVDNDCLGLGREQVKLFPQGMLPAFDKAGKLLLSEKHRLALAPDGHGGSLKALVSSGALEEMRARGVEIISYFQVDNPLVKPFDPLFLGLHAEARSEMSTKVARKANDLEKVGNVCIRDGRVCVVEYSDFPDELAHERNADDSRRFDAGNLAIHLLDTAFVDRIVGRDFQLPFRRAEKKVAYVDDAGERVEPAKPNAVKLETFVFDAMPLAERAIVLEVDRAEEFSPVKNTTGVDSLESSQRDQVRRAIRWLRAAGVEVPDGESPLTVCIAPRFALDCAELAAKAGQVPELRAGERVWVGS